MIWSMSSVANIVSGRGLVEPCDYAVVLFMRVNARLGFMVGISQV